MTQQDGRDTPKDASAAVAARHAAVLAALPFSGAGSFRDASRGLLGTREGARVTTAHCGTCLGAAERSEGSGPVPGDQLDRRGYQRSVCHEAGELRADLCRAQAGSGGRCDVQAAAWRARSDHGAGRRRSRWLCRTAGSPSRAMRGRSTS